MLKQFTYKMFICNILCFVFCTTTIAADNVEGIKLAATSYVTNEVNKEAIGVTKSFLQKYFPTVELQLDMFDYKKATSGILIVAPLSNPNDTKNTFFTQDSIYHRDDRTTVNLGLGYRRLEMDNKVMLGANGFYDYEFPYGNRRKSIGLEARTTVGELNFNQYWGASNWMNAANSYQEKSLGGTDIELGVPLPYMNWAKVYGRGFIWRGVDGANDLKGTDISLRAQLPILSGLAIEGGRRTYTNDTRDENFLRISYNLTDMSKPNPDKPWFTSKAYSLDSMENQRYNKVRRENMIMKQARSTGTTTPFSCATLTTGFICTQKLGTALEPLPFPSGNDTTSLLNGGGTLVWSPNNNTIAPSGQGNYSTAASTCSSYSAFGFSSGWRLPTAQELAGLNNSYSSAVSAAGWISSVMWSSSEPFSGAHYSASGNNFGVQGNTFSGSYATCVYEVL
jgi:adhesin/invasin